MEYMPKVLQAVAGEDFTLYLYFSDGSVRLYDAKPLLERGGVFEPMRASCSARNFRLYFVALYCSKTGRVLAY